MCPEDGGAHPGLRRVLSRRLPLHHGQSLNPATKSHHARLCFTRHQTGVHVVHPSGLPLACDPPDGTGRLGLFPELRTPPTRSRTTHVGEGTGHRARTWNYRPLNSHPSISNPIVHSCRATSRRTAQGRWVRLQGRCGRGRDAWDAGDGGSHACARLRPGAVVKVVAQRAAGCGSASVFSEESCWVSYLALRAAIASLSGGPLCSRISASSTK